MSSLSRNSCAKAFGNWLRDKNQFYTKKNRGGGGVQRTPPASLRVKSKNFFKVNTPLSISHILLSNLVCISSNLLLTVSRTLSRTYVCMR